jgi:hypothetical protein
MIAVGFAVDPRPRGIHVSGVARLAQLAVVMVWTASGCSSSKSQPSVSHTSNRAAADAGGAVGDAAVSGDAGDGKDSGVRPRSDAGVARSDAGTKPKSDSGVKDAGGVRTDAGQLSGCALVSCPPPSVCDESSGQARCACPAGYEFLDVGGKNSPCVAIEQCTDCDGG